MIPALGGLDPSARAIINAFTTPPTADRKALINSTVRSLKAGGVWAKLDSLFFLAAADSQAARVDWKRPTVTATATNSPTFAADRGYTFDGSTNYLDTNFNPATQGSAITGTTGLMASYERTNLAADRYVAGVNDGTNIFEFAPRSSVDRVLGRCGNATSAAMATDAITNSQGLTVVQRVGTNAEVYKNGAALTGAALGSPSSGLPSRNFFIGCRNNAGTPAQFRATQQSAVAIGGALSASAQTAFYTTMQAYMTAVGANV